MNEYLTILSEGGRLTTEQAEAAMRFIMNGEADPVEIAGFLMGLRSRGETLDELIGFTRVMRQFAIPVVCKDPNAIDLCGTGGDKSGTFNISTTAAFVAAGAGVTVAKHGNRSISSKCGSADVLAALGVNIELGKEGVEYCLEQAGIAFIFAPFFHPAMKYVMPVRRTMGVRTFFNILGPLCNPASVKRQIVGAFNQEIAETMARILMALGAENVVAVHASDGLDEFSIAAPATAYLFGGEGDLKTKSVSPEDMGLSSSPLSSILGDTAEENAGLLAGVLEGKPGPHRNVVLMNASYALLTSGRYAGIDEALDAAKTSIDSGKAKGSLQRLIEASQKAPARTA